jgi:hypothetical protein
VAVYAKGRKTGNGLRKKGLNSLETQVQRGVQKLKEKIAIFAGILLFLGRFYTHLEIFGGWWMVGSWWWMLGGGRVKGVDEVCVCGGVVYTHATPRKRGIAAYCENLESFRL